MSNCAQASRSAELSDEQLESYLLGRLPAGAELKRLEDHLIRCPACAGRAEEMTGSIAALIRALQGFESDEADNPTGSPPL
jgi:anti-sigma factor RsiW